MFIICKMWLVMRVKKTHLLCFILLLAFILLASSYLQLENFLSAQRKLFALDTSDPSNSLKETQKKQAEFYQTEKKGCRANYSSTEADDLVNKVRSFYTDTDKGNNAFNESEDYASFVTRLNQRIKRGKNLKFYRKVNSITSWTRFYSGITQHQLYQPDVLNDLLTDIGTLPIVATDEILGINHLQLVFKLQNGATVTFIPKRNVQSEVHPDHYFKSDIVSHISEIAAFHLDNVLGLYKAPPSVGRTINITSDVFYLANKKLRKQLYRSEEGEICIEGSCRPGCADSCGDPERLEGSITLTLPLAEDCPRRREKNPLVHEFSKIKKVKIDKNFKVCHQDHRQRRLLKAVPTTVLEIVEMSIFDFLIDNMNRHFIEKFSEFGNDTFLLHVNNGKGFAKAKRDCASCLSPLQQCCLIRMSTLLKLVKLYLGPSSLSQIMRGSLLHDPLAPILSETHLNALDRRLCKVLKVIRKCLLNVKHWKNVVIDDVTV